MLGPCFATERQRKGGGRRREVRRQEGRGERKKGWLDGSIGKVKALTTKLDELSQITGTRVKEGENPCLKTVL